MTTSGDDDGDGDFAIDRDQPGVRHGMDLASDVPKAIEDFRHHLRVESSQTTIDLEIVSPGMV